MKFKIYLSIIGLFYHKAVDNLGVMKTRLSFISDILFYSFAFFFLSFVIINYFVKRPFSFVLSATLALLLTLLFAKLSVNKSKKKEISAKEQKLYASVMTELNLLPEQKTTELFATLFRAQGYEVKPKRGGLFIPERNVLSFTVFGYETVTKAYIVKVFNRLSNGEKAEIYSENFSAEISAFSMLFNGKIVLKDGKEIFGLLKEYSLLPNTDRSLSAPIAKKIDFPAFLDKKRAKNYLVFGLSFVILSYFVPIKIYYLAFGVFFLVFSLILRFFGKTPA